MNLVISKSAQIALRSLGGQIGNRLVQELHRISSLDRASFLSDRRVHALRLPRASNRLLYQYRLPLDFCAIIFIEDNDTLVIDDVLNHKRLDRILADSKNS